jgi:Cu/Ag efflux protein CusF
MPLSNPVLLLASIALAAPALAQEPPAKAPKATYHAKDTRTARATVKEIDLATRRVTLQTEDGKVQSMVVGPEARNLEQVKVGDEVVVHYQQALAIQVKAAEPGAVLSQPTEELGAQRAAPGEKPAGIVARKVTLNATVEAIDKKKQTVRLKGSGGNTVELQVKDPKRLENVKVGDIVTAEYSEAMALAVQPASPKPPAKAPATK